MSTADTANSSTNADSLETSGALPTSDPVVSPDPLVTPDSVTGVVVQGVSVSGGNGSGGNSLGHSDATQGSLVHGLEVHGSPVCIGLVADWEPSSAKRIDRKDSLGAAHRMAVVRIADDFYAIGDRCSHADISLAEGSIWEDECQIECFKHGSLFSLTTGAPLTFPATKPVPVYTVSVQNGEVFVELP